MLSATTLNINPKPGFCGTGKMVLGKFLKVQNRGEALHGKFYQIQNIGEITLGETSKNLKIQGKPVRGNVEKKFP